MIRKIDNFWAEFDRLHEVFENELKTLSDEWESGDISGPKARKELSRIKQFRATMVDSIKARPEFVDVPLTLEDRRAYAREFNKPPQLPHPVDELIEQYYSVDPESLLFKNDITGETDWDAYFKAREQVLNSAIPEISAVARDSLAQSDTPLERMLFVSKEWLREYYGIRQDLIEEIDPNLQVPYIEYRKLQHLSRNTVDVEVSAGYKREAIEIAARFPVVRDIEMRVKSWRKEFRKGDPTMETVFQMFISSPPTAPTIPQTRDTIRSVQGVAGVGGVSGVQGVQGIR